MAENFAAALLMPEDVVGARWRTRGDPEIHAWLNASATALRVSAVAFKWRLRSLGLLTPIDLAAIEDARLVANGGELTGETPPPPFSSEFVRRVHAAVESGRLSLRRAAKLLGVALSEFVDLCHQYGLTLSYDV